MDPARDESSATPSSKRGCRVVRVTLAEKASRHAISLADNEVLLVWVYGSPSALRVLVDGATALERELSKGERAHGKIELSLDRPEFSRWTRFTEVELEARHEVVDSPRGASSSGQWTRAATIVVRGGQARGMVLALCLLGVVFSLVWAALAQFAASPMRRALDYACVAFALSVWAIWFGAGGARGARLALAWLVTFFALSAASLSATTIVDMNSYGGESAVVRHGESRWMRHEVRRTGDRVTIGRETFVAMLACRKNHDSLAALRFVSGYESIASRPTSVVLEQAAARLLMIDAPENVECSQPPWIQVRRWTARIEPSGPDAQRYVFPSVSLDSQDRIRASDLALGEPRLIRFRSTRLSNVELQHDRLLGIHLRFEREHQPHAIGLWLGRLGAGWSGISAPFSHARHVRFRCSPNANSIMMLRSNPENVRRIESARFAVEFVREYYAIACFDDPGDAFDRVTVVLNRENASPQRWRELASEMLADWKTTRLVLAGDASETPLAEIYRPNNTLASERGFMVVSLEGSLADATEIASTTVTPRTVLWRRSGARRVVVLLNVAPDRLLDPQANSLVVRVGDGPAASERRAQLVRREDSYALIEVEPTQPR